MKTLTLWYRMISPANIDLTLYIMCAVFGAQQALLSGDDAYKYINPYVLYWMKFAVTSLAAGALAAKMYRSTGYADGKAKKVEEIKKEEDLKAVQEAKP